MRLKTATPYRNTKKSSGGTVILRWGSMQIHGKTRSAELLMPDLQSNAVIYSFLEDARVITWLVCASPPSSFNGQPRRCAGRIFSA